MTHEECVRAAAARVPVVYNSIYGRISYKRISAIYWRYSSDLQKRRGMPETFMQVELEDWSGTSVTVAKPEKISAYTEETA